MPVTTNDNITYNYLGEYSESYHGDGNSSVFVIQTAWTNAIIAAFAYNMMGAQEVTGNKITRLLPAQHPTKTSWYCTRVKLRKGVGAYTSSVPANNAIQFTDPTLTPGTGKAEWECTFSYLPYDVIQDEIVFANNNGTELQRFVERKRKYLNESLVANFHTWRWKTDNNIASPNAIIAGVTTRSIQLPTVECRYKWWWVPEAALNEDFWGSMIGKVNRGVFDNINPGGVIDVQQGLGAAAQTVLFQNWDMGDRVWDALGTPCRHPELSFIYRPTGWNKLYRQRRGPNSAVKPAFESVVDKATGTKGPYLTVNAPDDLDDLFKVVAP